MTALRQQTSLDSALLTLAVLSFLTTPARGQLALSRALNISGDDGVRQPFVDHSGRAGGLVEAGEAAAFLPLAQNECELLFADIRGKIFDDESKEGNCDRSS